MKAPILGSLTLLLVSATTPVLCAKERILLHRIGPSQSTLFIAKADGSGEPPLAYRSLVLLEPKPDLYRDFIAQASTIASAIAGKKLGP